MNSLQRHARLCVLLAAVFLVLCSGAWAKEDTVGFMPIDYEYSITPDKPAYEAGDTLVVKLTVSLDTKREDYVPEYQYAINLHELAVGAERQWAVVTQISAWPDVILNSNNLTQTLTIRYQITKNTSGFWDYLDVFCLAQGTEYTGYLIGTDERQYQIHYDSALLFQSSESPRGRSELDGKPGSFPEVDLHGGRMILRDEDE